MTVSTTRKHGALDAAEAEVVRRLADAAAEADGVAPLGEQTLLDLTAPRAWHVLALRRARHAGRLRPALARARPAPDGRARRRAGRAGLRGRHRADDRGDGARLRRPGPAVGARDPARRDVACPPRGPCARTRAVADGPRPGHLGGSTRPSRPRPASAPRELVPGVTLRAFRPERDEQPGSRRTPPRSPTIPSRAA